VVSNSSPLILDARIGHLDLLRAAFAGVVAPWGVRTEIVVRGAGVLLRANEAGLIVAVRPLLDALRSAGLYLGNNTYGAMLHLAGEAS
jgi:predicted nucleic acid-binding protein